MTKHIAFIGIDGSGKSTLANLLYEEYPDRVVLLKEPGLKETMAIVDRFDDPMVHALAFLTDRFAQLEMLRTLKLKDKLVVFDRWHDCTIAYQGHGGTVSLDTLNQFRKHLPHLDYIFWVDCLAQTAYKRAIKRADDRYSLLNLEQLTKIQSGYQAIYQSNRHNPRTKYYRLDAESHDPLTLLNKVKTVLKLNG